MWNFVASDEDIHIKLVPSGHCVVKRLYDGGHCEMLVDYIRGESENYHILVSLKAVANLNTVIRTFSNVTWRAVLTVIVDIFSAICHLHRRGHYHGRIHERNVLFYKGGYVRLSDFGQYGDDPMQDFEQLKQKDWDDANLVAMSLLYKWIDREKSTKLSSLNQRLDEVNCSKLWPWVARMQGKESHIDIRVYLESELTSEARCRESITEMSHVLELASIQERAANGKMSVGTANSSGDVSNERQSIIANVCSD